MDKMFKLSYNMNNEISSTDIDTLNEFLSKPENDEFEITKIKELRNNEILIVVSDY